MTDTDAHDPIKIALTWWAGLAHDKATRAQLARASVQEAALHPAVAELWQRLGYRNPDKLPRIAALATLLATIRENDSQSFWRAIGRDKVDDPSSAKLKSGRFQALMRADATDEEFALLMRRAINMAGNTARVSDVVRLTLYRENDSVRNRAAISYYGADVRSTADAAAA